MKNQSAQIRAFTTVCPCVANALKNKVIVSYNGKAMITDALWDTGATGTCISSEVAQELELIPTGCKTVKTPSGSKECNTFLVNIQLPNDVSRENILVCETEIGNQGIGVLIGMDIINSGDFAVSSYSGVTVFSFRSPAQQTVDYVKILQAQKALGPKHGQGKRKKKR